MVRLHMGSQCFPDPKAMLSRLKARGLKICAWINPYIAQKSSLFDEGMEKGYLLKMKQEMFGNGICGRLGWHL